MLSWLGSLPLFIQVVHELGESAHRVCSNAIGKNNFFDAVSHAVQRKLHIRTGGPRQFKKHRSRGRAARRREQYFLYVVHAQRRVGSAWAIGAEVKNLEVVHPRGSSRPLRM